jgi:hypothetical protein
MFPSGKYPEPKQLDPNAFASAAASVTVSNLGTVKITQGSSAVYLTPTELRALMDLAK